MRVAIEKLEGVELVEVSLNQGLARIRFKPGNTVRLEAVRALVENNGFTPKEARVALRGELALIDGKLQLKVTGLDLSYELEADPKAAKTEAELNQQVGKTLLLEGRIPPPAGKKAPHTLHWASFRAL